MSAPGARICSPSRTRSWPAATWPRRAGRTSAGSWRPSRRTPAAVDAELQHCLTNWRLERLSAIDRNVLRIAAVEMLRFDDIPPRVSIREALWLAEKYGTDRSPSFVNGVLDALMRRTGRS
jgi:hypothetical protein